MTTSTSSSCEQNKLRKLQLPNVFKKIGFGILIASFVGLIINKVSIEEQTLRSALKYGMLLGLLIVSISKEAIEDEFIIKLRMQSYTFAFIAAVIFSFIMPFMDYFVDVAMSNDAVLKNNGDFQILWTLLSFQIAYFELVKRSHS